MEPHGPQDNTSRETIVVSQKASRLGGQDALEFQIQEHAWSFGARGLLPGQVTRCPSPHSAHEPLSPPPAYTGPLPSAELASDCKSQYSPTSSTFSRSALGDDVASTLTGQTIGAFDPQTSQDSLVSELQLSKESWQATEPPAEIARLPSKRSLPIWRRIRFRLFQTYQRLFSFVILANIAALISITVWNRDTKPFGPSLDSLATATAANITAAILMRQENVINLLYRITCATPHWMPLRFRRWVAKFYQFGGVHSSCALSGTLWYIYYTILMTWMYIRGEFTNPAVMFLTGALVTLLSTICLFAIPQLRFRSHNTFEAVHRYGGWSAIALFWAQVILLAVDQSREFAGEPLGLILIKTPSLWFLIAITLCIIIPWLSLQKVEAWPEALSGHAVRLHFNYTKVGLQSGIRIAHSPLGEWHPFAAIPAADGSSFSVIVSAAGDWTRKQVERPSYSYWVRGIPLHGMLRMACVFKRVVIVTTGSGIGPCLSLLIGRPIPCRILWSSRTPCETFGQGTMDAVAKADPNAMVIDTSKTRHPDMAGLAYHMYKESNAEAVFVISNIKLTKKVVYSLESRGIPAFGPIWDS